MHEREKRKEKKYRGKRVRKEGKENLKKRVMENCRECMKGGKG